MSAICCCPCSIKTTDHADAGFQPAQLVSLARFIASLFEPCSWLEPSALAARELLQFQKTGKKKFNQIKISDHKAAAAAARR